MRGILFTLNLLPCLPSSFLSFFPDAFLLTRPEKTALFKLLFICILFRNTCTPCVPSSFLIFFTTLLSSGGESRILQRGWSDLITIFLQ